MELNRVLVTDISWLGGFLSFLFKGNILANSTWLLLYQLPCADIHFPQATGHVSFRHTFKKTCNFDNSMLTESNFL